MGISLQDTKKEVEGLQADLERVQGESRAAEEKLSEVQAALAVVRREVEEKEANLHKTIDMNIKGLKEDLERMEEKNKDLEARHRAEVEGVRADLEGAATKREERLREVQAKAAEAQEEASRAARRGREAAEQLAGVRGQLTEAEGREGALGKRTEDLEARHREELERVRAAGEVVGRVLHREAVADLQGMHAAGELARVRREHREEVERVRREGAGEVARVGGDAESIIRELETS